MRLSELEAVVESLLFIAGDAVPLASIAQTIELDKATAKAVVLGPGIGKGNGVTEFVKTVLENYGYDVIDLGRDVAVEEVVYVTVMVPPVALPVFVASVTFNSYTMPSIVTYRYSSVSKGATDTM